MKRTIRDLTSNNQIIGVGTGTTIEKFIKYFDKDKIYVPSSIQTKLALHKYGMSIKDLALVSKLDLYIDGTDYFDNLGNLIKGKGGALTSEKLMCSISDKIIILAQDYKFKNYFKECYVPIEIIPQSLSYIKSIIEESNIKYSLRTTQGKHGPLITENGNLIIDVMYNKPFLMNIKSKSGVVEHGYFDSGDYNIVLKIFSKDSFFVN
jgi:ribose 5-phosphate isomerase A